MNFKNKLIIMNKKDLKKFLIENESHTIENTEEKLGGLKSEVQHRWLIFNEW